eukprot:NODE_1053_length_1683_cov_0.205808.p1 type:complete len:411 gc:universal NODE_1053_length_1683_cov_0.205808:1493-261(-)
MDQKNFFTICISGGPCSGKSSVQSILADVLQNKGYKVYCLPEAATTLFSCGVAWPELNEEQQYVFQKFILKYMITLEEPFIELCKINSKLGIKSIILTDRGTLDCSAYIERSSWLQMLRELNLKEVELRDARYDAIIHLVTAADGASQFYNLSNNTVRTESPELAKEIDAKIKNSWIGHPSLSIVDNSTGFDAKCNRVVQTVLQRIGLPDERFGGGIVKRKYLVNQSFKFVDSLFGRYSDFSVEHIYLNSEEDGQYRIRKRWNEHGVFYNLTIRKIVHNQKLEERRVLNAKEYDSLQSQRDTTRCIISKTRRCFHFSNHYFQLDFFQKPHGGLLILESYLEDEHKSRLPPFLPIESEITTDPQFSMFNLSLIQSNSPIVAVDSPLMLPTIDPSSELAFLHKSTQTALDLN